MTNIVKIADAYSFVPREGLTLLEAFEIESVALDYQCRQGFCGCCQVTLIDGEVKYVQEPVAFISASKILPCCCRPEGDVIIELPMPLECYRIDSVSE